MVKKKNKSKKTLSKKTKSSSKKPLFFCKGKQKCQSCEVINKVKNYFKDQEEKIVKDQKKQFTWFVLGFIIFYLVLSGLAFPFADTLKESTGRNSQGLLSIQGIKTQSNGSVQLENFESAYSFDVIPTGQTIFISWLCSGVLEIIILVSAILASFGIAWKKKIIGAIAAIIIGYVFNLIRIWATLNIILTQNAQVFEIAHDTLFRAVLFVYIIVVYVLWFIWANTTSKK
jgi:exosortase/archaeosortase family protein